jgi:hypothetical protein
MKPLAFGMVAVLAVAACAEEKKMSSQPKELVAKWTMSQSSGTMTAVANYELRANGTFEMNGYPPIHVVGRWQVTDRKPGALRLKLYDQKMNMPSSDKTVTDWPVEEDWAELAPDGMSFKFKNLLYHKQP